jgi:hypothetical protein
VIVVAGMFGGEPGHGGATWAVLQYAIGLRKLGHDVLVLEQVQELRPASTAYFNDVMREFGFDGASAMVVPHGRKSVGLPYQRVRELTRTAELLLDVSGMMSGSELIGHIPVRVYLDLDPAFNQLWYSVEGIDRGFEDHTHFATVGLAIGSAGCSVPTCDRTWITTLPPVVLEEWPVSNEVINDAFTTVGNWRSYGPIEHEGVLYGQRAHSFRQFIELPMLCKERLAPALAIHPGDDRDMAALSACGWALIDPASVASTPAAYREFVQGSKAELGIAKSGYVVSQCGWFSDRSACYLASGRPVLAQETGFSDFLPSGEGLVAFRTIDEAVSAVTDVGRRYELHCRAARALAEEFLDSKKVLTHLLDQVGGSR